MSGTYTGSEQVLRTPTSAELRDELERLVLADLLGPVGGPEEEVADSNVRDRYLVGMLAPRGQHVDREEQDELATDGAAAAEEGPSEISTPQAPSLFPSSFGMSFSVDGAVRELEIAASWGQYSRQHSEVLTTSKTGAPLRVWRRARRGGSTTVRLREVIAEFAPDPEQPDVKVSGRARRRDSDWIVTLFLVNGQEEPKVNRDVAWIFQPELRVRAPGGAAVFRRRMPVRPAAPGADAVAALEAQSLAMLYRRQVEFAVGHGVSVHATLAEGDPGAAVEICTRVAPGYEVPQTKAPTPQEVPGLGAAMFDMRGLAEAPPADLPAILTPLATAYEGWIAARAAELASYSADLAPYRQAAERALQNCRAALARIREGIALLGHDPHAAEAFRFMNRAMWQQRVHSDIAASVRRDETPDLAKIDAPENRSWFPFQLAFILINLPGIADLRHPDRAVGSQATADLLWFPTGGGKTEAYLGLTAYTLAMRRLQGTVAGRSGEAGVAVLMRYTLRLLTLQQFQRAAALICACEMIRREALAEDDDRWGRRPFRLGLWVGMRTTPNTTEASHEAITQDRGTYTGARSGSPAQLTHCPWCGTPIDPGKNIVADVKGYRRTYIYCGDQLGSCPFTARRSPNEGLPLVVVDEEIYRLLPALIISTVDKFAQMPWNGATQMLFGQVDRYCPRHGFRSPTIADADSHPAEGTLPGVKSIPHAPLRPPDLIIQDELHLISGPLGTLVGLYESAVDRLASWEIDGQWVRPKVIASTATIRRASDQVHALFLRKVAIFPPQGLDIADNFFARQRPPSTETPGRRYLGICANGKRLKAALIRVYVALLGASARLQEQYGEKADPWMTLVGYFNSMNELAGMRRLVDDDVKTRLGKIDTRGLARRTLRTVEELTSRKSAGDIPRVLTLLETRFGPGSLPPQRGRGTQPLQGKGPLPLDVLLATNMISVGVDVKRLGLMVVAGQPKNTAEYIQATSRVGRSAPGLVCAVYNWARPRDLSHYESFEHYHATFYQHVEPLSVTPFAPRARDRGLAALLVSFMRLLGGEFNPNDGARKLLSANHPQIKAAIAELADRAAAVTGRQQDGDAVRAELQKLADEWAHQAQAGTGGRILGYKAGRDGLTVPLLHVPELGQWRRFTCLNSLRDVEPSVGLILNDQGFDQEPVVAGAVTEGEPTI